MLSNIIRMAGGAWKTVADAKTAIIIGGMIVAVLVVLWQTNNYQQRQIGAAKLQHRLQGDDQKTILEKRQNDVEIRNQSDDDLLNEFEPHRVPN